MTAVSSRPRSAVSVDELQRAWGAVKDGRFRRHGDGPVPSRAPRQTEAPAPVNAWRPSPGEQTIAVLGAAGSVGASTVSLALAVADPGPVRVVECCPPIASGLAAASTAEFGVHPSGWRQGTRKHVLLERGGGPFTHLTDVPLPTEGGDARQLTILDIGWDAATLQATDCWLTPAVTNADAVVVTTAATVPGLRRLEATLELLDLCADRVHVALVGFHRRRWPKGVAASAGPVTRSVLGEDRFTGIDHDRALAISGVDSRPLPEHLLRTARDLHDVCLRHGDAAHPGN